MIFPTRLIQGYQHFLENRLPMEQSRYHDLAQGQSPEIMVIGCCDSRVPPEVIFDAQPGELFVARNVANLVPPYSPDGKQHGVSAALEFAVQALKVRDIVVLGHAQCGGIQAFAEDAPPLSPGDFIGQWMELLRPVANQLAQSGARARPRYLEDIEKASLVQSLDNLATFPWIQDRVISNQLTLHAAYFGVATGALSIWNPRTEAFELLDGTNSPTSRVT